MNMALPAMRSTPEAETLLVGGDWLFRLPDLYFAQVGSIQICLVLGFPFQGLGPFQLQLVQPIRFLHSVRRLLGTLWRRPVLLRIWHRGWRGAFHGVHHSRSPDVPPAFSSRAN